MDAAYRVISRDGAWIGIEADPDTGEELDVITPRHRDNKAGERAALRDSKRWAANVIATLGFTVSEFSA